MLIIVEGAHDKWVLRVYLKHLGENIPASDIVDVEGKDKPKIKEVTDVIMRAIRDGKKIKIIFDVDKSYKKSKENIERQLEDIEKDLSKKCEIFLLPNDKDVSDDKDNANLETIFEKIAIEKEVFDCLKANEECLKTCSISKENRRNFRKVTNKDTLYAYLHMFRYKIDNKDPDPEIENVSKLLNLNDEYLQPLKNFLLDKDIKDK